MESVFLLLASVVWDAKAFIGHLPPLQCMRRLRGHDGPGPELQRLMVLLARGQGP